MAVGFYCTIIRAGKVGYLLGPYADEPSARAVIPEARRQAEAIDPFAVFDAFGTARLTTDGELPAGVLNKPG